MNTITLSTGIGYGPVSLDVNLDNLGKKETPIWAYAPNAGHYQDYNNVRWWEQSSAGDYLTEYTESNPFTPIRIIALVSCPDEIAEYVKEKLIAFSEYPILDEDEYYAAESEEAQSHVSEMCAYEDVPFDEIWPIVCDNYWTESDGIYVPGLNDAIASYKAAQRP